jgi:glycosyltransferase involved in cell wall biosynthesis
MDLKRFDRYRPQAKSEGPLRILWNHRWEYDKRPKRFFDVLYQLAAEDVPFELIVLGESFRQKPTEFITARQKLAERILHFGFVEDEADYARYLWLADVNVSCAIQDFFGGSTVEAMYCDCYPLLPNRLTYPTFVPGGLHGDHLYDDRDGLFQRLRALCLAPEQARSRSLGATVAQYDWAEMGSRYDGAFERVIESAAR